VYDPRAPSSQLALTEYAKPGNAAHLLRYATWWTKDEDAGKDLLADAMERVLDPEDRPWNPARGSFRRHMRMLMGGDAIEQKRTGVGKYEVVDSESDALERAIEPLPQPDALLHRKRKLEWMREMWAALVARLGEHDHLPLLIYELACEGRHDEPEELAEVIGVPVEQVYEAMRRLRYHAGRVREEWDKREKQRMAGLRAEAERARNHRKETDR
jgi:DNA-directed RNA polymerase specialized sigma24 family protein